MIPPNAVIAFDGNHADIPTGWVRDTRFDGKYPKGGFSNSGTTGGAATHSHTSPGHTHILPMHTHTGTSGNSDNPYGEWTEAGVWNTYPNHTHNYTSGYSSGGTTNSTSVVYGSVSNDPPFYTVIFIKADSYNLIPVNGIVLRESLRDKLTYHAASENKFLKGEDAEGDAGRIGGSTTNIHDISHTHEVNSHPHEASTSGGTNNPNAGWGGVDSPSHLHAHTMSFANSSQAITAFSGTLTTTETVEPLHTKIKHYYAPAETPVSIGDICLFIGDTTPLGWALCDGTYGTPNLDGYYIKNVDTDTTTGGSNTHSHTAQSHQHPVGDGHVHSATGATNWVKDTKKANNGGILAQALVTHGHVAANSNSASIQYNASDTSAVSVNNEPLYIQVKFIQATKAALGNSSSIMSNFIL